MNVESFSLGSRNVRYRRGVRPTAIRVMKSSLMVVADSIIANDLGVRDRSAGISSTRCDNSRATVLQPHGSAGFAYPGKVERIEPRRERLTDCLQVLMCVGRLDGGRFDPFDRHPVEARGSGPSVG